MGFELDFWKRDRQDVVACLVIVPMTDKDDSDDDGGGGVAGHSNATIGGGRKTISTQGMGSMIVQHLKIIYISNRHQNNATSY